MNLYDVLMTDVPLPVSNNVAKTGSTMLGIAEEDDPFWS